MNRLGIRNLIRKRLGETTAAFWTDPELNIWIDDACNDLAFKTKCVRANGKMTLTASTAEYALSTFFPNLINVLEVYQYRDGSTWEKLDSTTREELNLLDSGWKSVAAGVPDKYWWSREEDKISYYPKPNAANSGVDYAEVYYSVKHTNISGDTATIDIPEYMHNSIVDYVVALGHDTRGWGDKANDAWSKYYGKMKEYEVERNREKEDEEIISKNYKNI